jgi:hypothetical protein
MTYMLCNTSCGGVISIIDRGLATQSWSSKTLGKTVGVCTKKWMTCKRSPAYPAVIGYLATWFGKVKMTRKGTGHPTAQCCWPSTLKSITSLPYGRIAKGQTFTFLPVEETLFTFWYVALKTRLLWV